MQDHEYPKVLIGIPTAEIKKYCQDKFIASIKMLNYPNADILFVDNSPNKKNFRELTQLGFKVIYQNPAGKQKLRILADAHEEIRQYALRGGYRYLFHHESDVFYKDFNIIQNLMRHKKSVCAGLYNIGDGTDRKLSCSLVDLIDDRETEVLLVKLIEDEITFCNGSLQRVFNPSLGCTLIHREVLEKFQFRYEKKENAFPDYFMAVDLFRQGISCYVDTSQLCNHYNMDWGLYGIDYK
jgi:hypothetical protein